MLLDALEGHALWSATYDSDSNPLLELERRTVEPWLPSLASSLVVDVGCGTGRWARYGEGQGARVFALDFCAPMLHQARAVDRIQADALLLPLRRACADVAICAFTAGYLESPRRLIGELARITRRGGLVLLTDVHPSAIASGWRRSFRYGDGTCEIGNRAHPLDSVITAASRAGLILLRWAEPALGEPERHIFHECGCEDRFAAACAVPAIYALLWRRT